MRVLRTLAVVAAVSSTTGLAHAQSVGQRVADQAAVGADVTAVGVDSFAEVRVPFPGGVVGMPDVTYSSLAGYRPLKLDLFLPPERFRAMGPRPLVLYIHGGGWVGGGPRRSAAFLDWPKVLASLAEQGYVVASVSYRFANEAPFPAQIQDVKSAIRWLRVNGAKYNIDPDRAAAWGQSAGGHLAALAALTCKEAALAPAPRVAPPARPVAEIQASAPEGFDAASDCVQAAVSWFGIYDFATLYAPQPGRPAQRPSPLLGCGSAPCTPEQLRAPSPVAYVDAGDPPILLMHGTEDTTVPIAQSQEFYEALKAEGVRTEFIAVPGVGHSFLGKGQPETAAASKMAMQRTVDFFEATIGDKAPRR